MNTEHDNPYRSPDSGSTNSPTSAKPRRLSPLMLCVAICWTTCVGAGMGLTVTVIIRLTQEVHPLDRWAVFWSGLIFGGVAGFIGGAVWVISLVLRQRR